MEAVAGWIDTPVDGAVLDPRHPVAVAGWAYGRGSPVVFVDAYLDDDRLGRATAHGPRPDVGQALGDPAANRSGFTLTAPVTPGRRASGGFRVLVTLADGSREWLGPVKVRLRAPVGGHVEVPAPGSVLDRNGFRVAGWAWAPTGWVSRVDLYLGGEWLGRAGLGRPRPDVARALGQPDAALSGFDFHVVRPPAPTGGGDFCLEAVVTLVDGAEEQLPRVPVRFEVGPLAPGPETPAGAGQERRRRVPRSDAIRVLWSARGLDQGGSQLRMAELVARLQQDGRFHSTVLSPSDGPLRRALEATGATVELRPAPPLDDAAEYGRAATALAEWMNGPFDLVVGFTITSFPAVDVANGLGLPTVLRIGEAAPLPTVVGWLFGTLDPEVERRARSAVAGAAAVVSNSHAAVETYRSDGYRGRFVVLVTGVDVPAERPWGQQGRQGSRRALGIGPEERLLVCPASLWPVKGQAVLVTALKEVHSRYPNLSCALLGAADPVYARAIVEFAAQSGLGDVVRLLPFQGDLEAWWRSADVVACVSESEALPAAVLEGMAHRLPALGCRVGDLPRLIEPNVNGWLCDHSDLASMTGTLEEAAAAPPETLRRMGDAAVATVARCYDRNQMLERWIELLLSSAEGRTPTPGAAA